MEFKLQFQKHLKVNKKYDRHFIESLFLVKVEKRFQMELISFYNRCGAIQNSYVVIGSTSIAVFGHETNLI